MTKKKLTIHDVNEACQDFCQRIEALLSAVDVYADNEDTKSTAITLLDIAFEEADFLQDNLTDLWFNLTGVSRA